MDSLNILNIQRRKPRRSMLGTHRGYSIGFHLNEEPTPQPIVESDSITDSVSVSITNMTRRLPRKSMLGTRNGRRDSVFSLLPDTTFSATTSTIDIDTVDEAEKKDVKANDSFEELETFMMSNEGEDSVLATTLLDNTIVEMTGASAIPRTENETAALSENDNSTLDTTVTKPEIEDSVLTDTLNSLNSIIENNTRCVNRFNKQIEDLKNEIEEKNRHTEEIIELKCRLMKKFNLCESPIDAAAAKTPEPRKSKPRKCKAIIPHQKENIESSDKAAVPSKQIIRELRSTIKFLKTPRRSSRRSRSSTILTPHSMSFSIKNQLEQLLE